MHMSTMCRIRIKGRLDTSWSDRMAGLSVTNLEGPEGSETKLEGELTDQAALQGILATLGDLNLAIVSVETMDGGPREANSIPSDLSNGEG
jgi:hypothetical protein